MPYLPFSKIVSEKQKAIFFSFLKEGKKTTVNLEVAFPTFKNANNFMVFMCILILTRFKQYL